MIVSLLVIFFILLLGGIYSKGTNYKRNSNKNRKNYISLISILLILQSGLRNIYVGSDTYAYYLSFQDIKTTPWSHIFHNFRDVYQFGIGKDPGYQVFEKLIQIIISDYQVFLFVIATIFFTALGRFIYYNSIKLNHAILAYVIYSVLFYSFFSITGHRQTIATAIALYSFEWIKKRKLFYFLVLILLSSTIHKSVLLFIPFYVIANFKKTKLIYIMALIIFPISMVFRDQLAFFFKGLGGYEEYGINKEAGTFTFTIMYLLISIVLLVRIKYILNKNSNATYYYNAFALGLIFIPLTWVNPSAMRVVQYFSIFMLILIPLVVESFQQYSIKLQNEVMFISIVILIILFFKANINLEYKFFWQYMPLGDNYN